MTEPSFLHALRAALITALTLLDARLESVLGAPPASAGPACPACGNSEHVADGGGGLHVCGDCDHNWES